MNALTGRRVAILGVEHETNTYVTPLTGVTTADDFWVSQGADILELAGTGTSIGGALGKLAELDADIVPVFYAEAVPSGTIDHATYLGFRDAIVSGLTGVGAVDAVILVMHGAGVTTEVDDLETDLAAAVRSVVGAATPVVSPMDLHGNLTQAMADRTVPLGCHYYPHIDFADRGRESVELIARILRGEVAPTTAVERLPLLLPSSWTGAGPACRVNALCAEVERRPGIIDATFFHGFPWTDTPLVGASIVVTTDDDAALAREAAAEIGRYLWSLREDFTAATRAPADAVRAAVAVAAGGSPVVINEGNDNAGGGAPADGTHLLRALLDAAPAGACFGFLRDPSTASAAHAAGVGATLEVTLGGRGDPRGGAPIIAAATVTSLSDGRFVGTNAMVAGIEFDLGPSALLDIAGVGVIVATGRQQTFDPEIFRIHGVDVRELRIVALKSQNHFRAGFEGFPVITSDAPGATTSLVGGLERHRAPGPLHPRDPEAAHPR